jgi:dolichol kinase
MVRLLIPLLLCAAYIGVDVGSSAAGLPRSPAFAVTKGGRASPRHRHPRGAAAASPSGASMRTSDLSSSSSDDRDSLDFYDNSRRLLLPMSALLSLSLVSLAALGQHLPGPPIDAAGPLPPFWGTVPFGVLWSGSCDAYSPSLILRDASSAAVCIAGATVFVKAVTHSAKIGRIEPRDSRKIIHTLSAPLFVILWPLFSDAYGARAFAGIVPLLNALRLYLAGTGGGGDGRRDGRSSSSSESELAGAISRSGDARESLGGPFIYVMVLLFFTLLFWRDSPVGVVSLATMACGDGLADLVGRRWGSTNKWFFSRNKSMAGSAAFVAGSFVASFGLISWLTSIGSMDALGLSSFELAKRLLAIAVICAGVELIPVGDDNYSVPISAALLSAFLLS